MRTPILVSSIFFVALVASGCGGGQPEASTPDRERDAADEATESAEDAADDAANEAEDAAEDVGDEADQATDDLE